MNFVYILPQLPGDHWKYCAQLKNNGVNVLGIGAVREDLLAQGLRFSLTEYYTVDSVDDYEALVGAVRYFLDIYGTIDWIESNNMKFFLSDAKLRAEFGVSSGLLPNEAERLMSPVNLRIACAETGMKVLPCILAEDKRSAIAFAEERGYPVAVRLTMSAGIYQTFKLNSRNDLLEFLDVNMGKDYMITPAVRGCRYSYDAILNSKGEPLFESGYVFPAVSDKEPHFYVEGMLDEGIRNAGRMVSKSLNLKSRFIHAEWIVYGGLKTAKWEQGDLLFSGVSLVPFDGIYPYMLNYANSVNLFKIWADMIAFDRRVDLESIEKYFCAYAGRWDYNVYRYTHPEILSRFRANITRSDRMSEQWAELIGNQSYLAKFSSKDEMAAFLSDILKSRELLEGVVESN